MRQSIHETPELAGAQENLIMSFTINSWADESGSISFTIPSMAHRRFAIRALSQAAIVLASFLLAFAFLYSASDSLQEKIITIPVFVSWAWVLIGVVMSRSLVATLVRWRQARSAFKAMLRTPYPAGLVRGRQMMEVLKSISAWGRTEEQLNLCMRAIHMKLWQEGIRRVGLGRALSPGGGLRIFLQEEACVLTDDGGRNIETLVEQILEHQRECELQVDPLWSQLFSDLERDCLAICNRISAAEGAVAQAEQMNIDTHAPQTLEIEKVSRF